MITIIVGTNRKDSLSEKVAEGYSKLMELKGIKNQILKLVDLPFEDLSEEMYAKHPISIKNIYQNNVDQVDKFVFIIPEYNGGYPGVLKMFIDVCPPSLFHNKKAALVGISSGQAGNLRGTDQFTNILNYLKVNVLFSKPKLSGVEGLIDESNNFTKDFTIKQLNEHIELIHNF